MDTEFALEALQEGLEKRRPGIFNTDQGSQFTSRDVASKLLHKAPCKLFSVPCSRGELGIVPGHRPFLLAEMRKHPGGSAQ